MTLEDSITAAVEAGIARAMANLQTAPSNQKLALSLREAAETASMSEWTIRTAITRGELHAKQAGENGRYAIPTDCLLAWLHGTPQPVKAQPRRKGA